MIELPSAATPRVSLLIPVRGGTGTIELLRACLLRLAVCASESASETLLLLNDVTDDLRAWVERSVRGARVLHSEVNLGLAGGLRLLRAAARGELLVSLHQDTEVEPGWLTALVRTADERPEAGVIGSLVLDPDGVTVQAAGWILCADCSTFPPWWGGPAPARDAFERRGAFGVDYTPSSSLLLRAEVWDAFGGPDERLYPAYYVDVDLAMGSRSVGRSVLVEPRSVARHHRGSATTLRFRSFVAGRSGAIFATKWARSLERFVPRDELGGGIGPALARAEREAETLRREWPQRAAERFAAAKDPVDQRGLEQRCREHERVVQAEYIAFLEGRVAHLERELATRPPSI